MKLAVIGQGYVGLNVSISAASAGIKTLGLDTNTLLITNLLNGISHVPDIKNNQVESLIRQKNLNFSSDMTLIGECDVIIIAVPTPISKKLVPDLSFLEEACKSIANFGKEAVLIINESTSYPGTLRDFIKPTIDPSSEKNYLYASAPERIDPGNSTWNLSNTPRVIAGLTKEATEKTEILYSRFCKNIFVASSPEAAEAAKIFENTFRQVNIALVNEFSRLMNYLGITATDALNAAATKPFGFMPFTPGIGVGGHCIPVDPYYLTFILRKMGVDSPLIDLANKINLAQPREIAARISALFNENLRGKRIQVAGITYKADVPDMRESPAIELIARLRELGATVTWSDPLIVDFDGDKSQPLSTDIDMGLIISPHSIFKFDIWKNSGVRVLDLSASDRSFGWDKFL